VRMHKLVLLPILSLLLLSPATSGLDCQDGKIRGVNAGGWLLLEPWITPKLFEEVNIGDNLDKIVDEYTYAELVDPDFYKERLRTHWDTFVTKEDFEKVSSAGVTHVRIPVGYWYWDVIEGEPFPLPNTDESDPNNPLFYLKRALGWLDELGMKGLIDLHAAPGSQNGFDNSGRRGDVHWVSEDYPQDNANVARTIIIQDKIAANMARWIEEGAFKRETLYGISLLNEPAGWWDKVWSACTDEFYPGGYEVVRSHLPSPTVVNLQQAFKSHEDWVPVMPPSDGFTDISVDRHEYQCFGGYWNDMADNPAGWSAHLDASCNYIANTADANWPTYVGEFSLAVTECQKYLNGGFHTPYVPPDASESACAYYNSNFDSYPDEYIDFLRSYFIAQIDAFEYGDKGAGWMMWTMKTEDQCAPEWDFIMMLEKGVIPANLCERETFCSFH